jgi:hypothetical protein
MKGYIITAVIALAVVALVFRVGAVKKIVIGA